MSSFFLHFSLVRFKHQLLVFDIMTEKENFFFPVLVPETNICVPDTQLFVYDLEQEKRVLLNLYFLAVFLDHGIPTCLWFEIKKGYGWTHKYKGKLTSNQHPRLTMSFK